MLATARISTSISQIESADQDDLRGDSNIRLNERMDVCAASYGVSRCRSRALCRRVKTLVALTLFKTTIHDEETANVCILNSVTS